MRYLLSEAGKTALAEMARGNVLLAFDYDGTLAPIVDSPERAWMRCITRGLLVEVASRYPCAVVSGRARGDVLRFMDGIPMSRVVGNHGAEGDAPPRLSREQIGAWRSVLEQRCSEIAGVWIEDKLWSLSVHYRSALRKAEAHAAAVSAARQVGARVVTGKDVVNLVHPGAAHKGAALIEIRRQLGCDCAIYVGDDDTDEDAFGAGAPDALLGVRVGRRRSSRASWFLRAQSDIDALLASLLDYRPRRCAAAGVR